MCKIYICYLPGKIRQVDAWSATGHQEMEKHLALRDNRMIFILRFLGWRQSSEVEW